MKLVLCKLCYMFVEIFDYVYKFTGCLDECGHLELQTQCFVEEIRLCRSVFVVVYRARGIRNFVTWVVATFLLVRFYVSRRECDKQIYYMKWRTNLL